MIIKKGVTWVPQYLLVLYSWICFLLSQEMVVVRFNFFFFFNFDLDVVFCNEMFATLVKIEIEIG